MEINTNITPHGIVYIIFISCITHECKNYDKKSIFAHRHRGSRSTDGIAIDHTRHYVVSQLWRVHMKSNIYLDLNDGNIHVCM